MDAEKVTPAESERPSDMNHAASFIRAGIFTNCVTVAPTKILVSQSDISSRLVLTRSWYGTRLEGSAVLVSLVAELEEGCCGTVWSTLGIPKRKPKMKAAANQATPQRELIKAWPVTFHVPPAALSKMPGNK